MELRLAQVFAPLLVFFTNNGAQENGQQHRTPGKEQCLCTHTIHIVAKMIVIEILTSGSIRISRRRK